MGGNLSITADGAAPSNVTTITTITGNLTIGGALTTFPNFALLEVVQGNLVIKGITDTSLTELNDIFPVLDSIRGDLTISNDFIQRISGFAELDSVGGFFDIGDYRDLQGGNTVLTRLPSFDALRIIGGELCFFENDALPTLPPFSALKRIGEGFFITNNASLRTISGFEALTSVGDEFAITGHVALVRVSGFSSLIHIDNHLSLIDNVVLETISGFGSLETIGGDFYLDNNNALATLSGFEALATIVGNLQIGEVAVFELGIEPDGHPQLTTLPSFNALTSVRGGIDIFDTGLTSFSGFSALKTVGEGVFIGNNAVLATLSGFSSLMSVGDRLIIGDNAVLRSLPSFNMLINVESHLTVEKNPLLPSISGFESLTTIKGNLVIRENEALRSLSGFGMIMRIGTHEGEGIKIVGNPLLRSCCGLLRMSDGTATIPPLPIIAPSTPSPPFSQNPPVCNSYTSVINACQASHTIHADGDVPTDAADFTRIKGDLIIGGTITVFPHFPLLEAVEGNLVISGITTPALTSLNDIFPVLKEVQGDLLIQNNDGVESISGFAVLGEVGGNVSIGGTSAGDGNALLSTPPALNALERIAGDLIIGNNAVLPTSPAFLALESIGGTLLVMDNAQLSSCCGLLNLVEGTIRLGGGVPTFSGNATGCNVLTEITNACVQMGDLAISADGEALTGISSLKRIVGSLTIGGTITTFPDFAALDIVEGNLVISGITDASLTELKDIFPSLDSIRGHLIIQNNDRVETLTGFGALDSIGGSLEVEDNDVLRSVSDFEGLRNIGGDVVVSG